MAKREKNQPAPQDDSDLLASLEGCVVLGGKVYRIVDGPMRADKMLDAVKKGFVHEDRTALTIDRYE